MTNKRKDKPVADEPPDDSQLVGEEDVPSSEASPRRSRRREELRRRLEPYATRSEYGLVKLFDLWGNLETLRGTPAWEVGVAHAIRELLEALYKDQEEVEVKREVTVPEKFSQIQIPRSLRAKFNADPNTGKLTWDGTQSGAELKEITGLSDSFAYKWGCKELFKEAESASIESEFRAKLSALLRKNDPLATPPEAIEAFLQNFKKVRDYFVKISHSKGNGESMLHEWEVRVAEAESIIVSLVADQIELFKIITDELLSKPPSQLTLRQLAFVVHSNTASLDFFFDKIDEQWLDVLEQEGFFTHIPQVIREPGRIITTAWAPSRYLVRIASKAPGKILTVLSRLQFTDDTNTWVISDVVQCLKVLSDKVDISEMLKRLLQERWLKYDLAWSLIIHSVELWQTLLSQGSFKNAAILLDALLSFETREHTGEQIVKPYLNDYYLRQVLDALNPTPITKERLSLIYVLARKLNDVFVARQRADDRENGAELRFHGSELFDHEKYISHALVSALSKYAAYDSSTTSDVLPKIIGLISKEQAQKRLRVEILIDSWPHLRPETVAYLLDTGILDWETIDEVLKGLPRIFPELSTNERTILLHHIESGPRDKDEQEYIDYWKRKRLRGIWSVLTDIERERFAQHAPRDGDETPETGATWHGPTSPLTHDQLASQSAQDTIKYLVGWKPAGEWFTDSAAGLGRSLADIVTQDPQKFALIAPDFYRPDINPTYLYHLLQGFKQAVRDKISFPWERIFDLLNRLCEASASGTLPVFETQDRLHVDWAGVFQAAAELLEDGFKRNAIAFSEAIVPVLSNIISFVASFPDPSDEGLREMQNEGREPGDVSVNSTQGWGTYASIGFLLWLKKGNSADFSKLSQSILEKLISLAESQYHISYILGKSLPWIFGLGDQLGQSVINRILKSNNQVIAYSGWSGYLHNRLWKKVHLEIEPAVSFFFENLVDFEPPWKDRDHTHHELGHHLANAYLFSLTEASYSTLTNYFEISGAEFRASVIQFIGSVYMHRRRDEEAGEPPPTDRLLRLWNDRLEKSSDSSELANFGWWMEGDVIQPEQAITRFLKTLQKSEGKTEPLLTVSDTLIDLFPNFPVQVLECLVLIVSGNDFQQVHGQFADGRLKPLIASAEQSGDEAQKSAALRLKNALLKLGMKVYF